MITLTILRDLDQITQIEDQTVRHVATFKPADNCQKQIEQN